MGLFSSSSSASESQTSSGAQTQQGGAASLVFTQGKNSNGTVNLNLTDQGAVGAAIALGSEAIASNERSYARGLAFADAETDDALAAAARAQSEALQFSAGAFSTALDAANSAFSSGMGAANGAYYSSLNAVGGAFSSSINATQSATDRAIAALLSASASTASVQKVAYQDSLAVLGATTEAARADLEERQDRSLKEVFQVAALGIGAVAVFSWLK